MKQFVIAGIGTEIGKTFISAVITQALEADYWKPVQAGGLDYTDTDFVRQHISNQKTVLHPEGYRLKAAMSPHAAAAAEGISIDLAKLAIPATPNHLVIEMAGGLMVPLNNRELNTELLKRWDLPVVLVSQNYLGSINHTLLSLGVLKQLGIRVAGIVFNGNENPATEEVIQQYSGIECIARIAWQKQVTRAVVKELADGLKDRLEQHI